MKKLILLALIVSLSSCGIFKRVRRESTLDKVQTSSVVKSDSTSLTVDKSITIIKEKADTVLQTPTKVVTQETVFNMDSLVNGMTAVKNDLIDVKVTLDPATNKLVTTATLKPQDLRFRFDRETTTKNDITTKGEVHKESSQKSNEEHKTNKVDKKPAGTVWYVVIILGVVAIIVFALYKRSGGK